jgi:hypothetical protein
MTQREDVAAPPGYRPGEPVLVFVFGIWRPAVVLSEDAGRVLARYQRADGELAERAFPRSSVVAANAL